jgi:hypothetical protein
MTVKYRVQLMESERGWGREYWQETFDTYEEAKERIRKVNAQNTSSVAPDWYMQAEDTVEAIEEHP